MPKSLTSNISAWVTKQVGTIKSAHQLAGSTSTTLYCIHTDKGAFVLRLFDNAEWLKDEPDLAPHEAAVLQKAAGIPIPTPELIAVDDADECSLPVLLMTLLPGEVVLAPKDMDAWLRTIANTLVAIHATDASDFGWSYKPWFSLEDFALPSWSKYPHLWEQAYEIVSQSPPETPLRFIHRDYHPTNFLWEGGKISAVVDWVNACKGPIGVDIAHCRGNLVSLYGVETAHRFLRHYETLSGNQQHPYWDLAGLFGFYQTGEPYVYPPWLEFGITGLTVALIGERADAYLADVMRRV